MFDLFSATLASPIGEIEIQSTSEKITALHFLNDDVGDGGIALPPDSPVCLAASVTQLAAYFAGQRRHFDLPLAPAGTDFQQQVWRALQEIPFGQTTTYGRLAVELGNPGATRAVGLANGRNPIGIIIPCHRVIGHNGKLTGYASGLWRKAWLLQHEGALPAEQQLRLV